ncbi:MAG: hypothetical protein MUC79_01010 [Thiobacillaceae bacterium]|jgi:hypothetical protein|nr:hypothetical protein [Thiobacillaceae bacterium]
MHDELSPEDLLRLQVLLAQDLKAVRLDDANTALVALTDKGEATVPLHPTCRPDRYMRLVQELLSGHALGSPGGYPIYLTRWTRHGQMETENLGKLLLIGEPEAVVAVVHSPALTDQLAEYAWWAMPTIENARLMLRREAVSRGRMGKVLVDFLVEHLPFLQDDHLAIMDTVAVLLASPALDAEQRAAVWRRGKQTNSYYVAFLEQAANDLPEIGAAGRDAPGRECLDGLVAAGNIAAAMLARARSAQGQAFLAAAAEVLARPETQEVVNRLLKALGERFRPAGMQMDTDPPGLEAARAACPELAAEWDAIAALARVSDALSTPIFARTTAIGSLMRRKIEPLVAPLRAHIQTLRGRPDA